MFVWNNERKVRALASDLAQAMRRRYGPEAETICTDALQRRELIGVRRQITRIALQSLRGLSSSSDVGAAFRPMGGSGPFKAA